MSGIGKVFLRCRLSELVPRAQALAELRRQADAAETLTLAGLGGLLLAAACLSGPRHPASPPPPQLAARVSQLAWQTDPE